MISKWARGPLLTALAIVAFAPLAASAQPGDDATRPFERAQDAHAREVLSAGNAARGIVPLAQLWRMSDQVPPERTRQHLARISAERRLSPAVRAYASWLAAQQRLRDGDVAGSRAEIDRLGFLRAWRVIGPFDNEGKAGFEREDPPEAGRMEAIDPDARYQGRERPVGWRDYPDVTHFGYVSFDAVFRPWSHVCGYAETFVESPRAENLSLWVGGGGAMKVWWNGELVHTDDAYRNPAPDRAVALVGARAGLNRVLVKACVTDRNWGFYLRLGDANGATRGPWEQRPMPPAEEVEAVAPSPIRGRPRPPVAPFAALSAAAEGERASARALEDLARFLVYTGADDPAEERARQLAARAAERELTVPRAALASSLANQRGDSMRFASQALAAHPDDPAAILLSARLIARGPSPEEALPLLRRLSLDTTQGLSGAQLEADIMRDVLGLADTARTRVEAAAARAPGAARWAAARAAAAGHVDRRDELIERHREVLALRYDDLGARSVLIDDALARGDARAALEALEGYRAVAADRAATYVLAANVNEALGREEQAFAALRDGLVTTPEEPTLHVALGRALLRVGQRDLAAASLRQALALRPQDASSRELLEQIEPEERRDEAYAVEPEVLLARRSEAAGHPTRVLADLQVTTVYESGLGSRFRQVAVQIHDDEGARQWRSYSIQFDPDVQRVDVRQARVLRDGRQLSATRSFVQRMGEPWYRIYYDTRALVLVFSELEPGDVVEIRYRLDDVAPRNLFHDYFGDLRFLQQRSPVARLDYVLITPSGRDFHFNEPRLAGLSHERTEQGDERIDHFFAEEVPALSPEPGMPGMTEVAPYLHVSTYRTWEDVGRWYWGLIQDQLYADESLRNTVAELMRGATDTREKVRRVFDWVIRNTRYVGLEFGIHGFLPYRVPDIVQRGFGDCKDKASLIYTMLREAGIDARIVLVRTRRNGQITDLPASLAVFDHAIAYVPELDLYLDGTAESSGIDELPAMDQGVTVLHVGPDDVSLGRTPVLPPERNQRERQVTLHLERDGSGAVTLSEEVLGPRAPSVRARYQAEGVRQERLERAMRGLFPGLEISRSTFGDLDDFDRPATFRFEGRAPQLAVRDGQQLRVAPSALGELSRSLTRLSSRSLPLDLGDRSRYVEERTIRLPAGFEVADLPEAGEASSDFGRLAIEVDRQGREVRIRTELVLAEDRVAADRYPELRAWVEQADRLLNARLILTPGGGQ